MPIISDTSLWAQELFGHAQLGDTRRTSRLVTLASAMGKHQGQSIVKACNNKSEQAGAYRLLNNSSVDDAAIAEAGFAYTADCLKTCDESVLAIEDTTALSFRHRKVADDLGHITTSTKSRGLLAHSVLLFCPKQEEVVGLIDQWLWTRDLKRYGKKHQRADMPYEEKESFKWQRSSQAIAKRLGAQMAKVISVCDREADVFEYLTYKVSHQQRFVVRATQNRRLLDSPDGLFALADTLKPAGEHTIKVEQRGGRKGRMASLRISFSPVTLREPKNKSGQPVSLNYICCQEADGGELCWHLLTSEPVESAEQARLIVGYYERRWLIEEFHKAWKTGGSQVEELRLQSVEGLRRMSTVLGFVAVRLLQLRQIGIQGKQDSTRNCEELLTPTEWKLLWLKREGKQLPTKPPSLHWAYINLAKLAGWYDSKRTGRVGWVVLWEGWFLLQTMVEGYQFMQSTGLEI